jgi:hypothetical protein
VTAGSRQGKVMAPPINPSSSSPELPGYLLAGYIGHAR